MAYVIRNGVVLYADKNRSIKVATIPLIEPNLSSTKISSFRPKSDYKVAIEAINKIIDQTSKDREEEIILGIDLFDSPGFLPVLKEGLNDKRTILSEVETCLNNIPSDETDFFFVYFDKAIAKIFEVRVVENAYSLIEKTTCDKTGLIERLYVSLKQFCNAGVENPRKLTPSGHGKVTPVGHFKLTPFRQRKLTPCKMR